MKYNWQQPDWPHFRYDLSTIHETLFAIAEKTGLISGKLTHLADNLQTEAMINLMIEEAVKTSEIEGEYISRLDVRSSIKNTLGLNQETVRVHDKRAQGVVEMMFDVRRTFKQSLTKAKLFDWHLMLLSGSFNPNLSIACWRTHKEPMQIVSGHHGRWVVHYEAPPSQDVPKEMVKFIRWFNSTAPGKSQAIKFAPVRAAIAHLYFESIHPFEDGNGRIGRAIAEKALSQGFGYPAILSLSQAIEAEKKAYYAALNSASRSNEITAWIQYFVNIVLNALIEVEAQINFILKKSVYFDTFKNILNERQLKVVRRMMEAGVKGFEGGMSAKKYMKISGTSKATATRDLQHLLHIGALKQIGSGRSARYELNYSSPFPNQIVI
ncbi:MAG: Fic family protein [Gammaproteobacteria bacterium]|nr:MAG: Fic family protein [Gammaproteobacteria bacterium]